MVAHGDEMHGDLDVTSGTTIAATDGSADSHSGMDMSGASMGMMMSSFTSSMSTPLFSEAWTPNSVGTYAATCIFLIVLAMIFRAILAGKGMLEARWLDQEMARRYIVVAGKQTLAGRLSADSDKRNFTLSENGVEENVTVVQRRDGGHARPWRLSIDPVRAVLDTIIAGVGYLLMLAVMTMNVGYFMSVLAGVFLGSLAVGRFATGNEH
jgi:hypothetical protein